MLKGDWMTAAVALPLAGALLGFLRFNLPPATIFLGDCGSMVVGLVLGVLAYHSALKGVATVALAAPLALLIIPILDTSAALLRRKLTGRSIFFTDRDHLHHCLLRKGLSVVRVLFLVSALSLVALAGVVVSVAWNADAYALLAAAFVVFTLVATRLFGHTELMLLQSRLIPILHSLVLFHPQSRDRQKVIGVQGSAEWGYLWWKLVSCARKLDLQEMRLEINIPFLQEAYHGDWEQTNSNGEEEKFGWWRTEIPLTAKEQSVGSLRIAGRHDQGGFVDKMAQLDLLVGEIERVASDLMNGNGEGSPLPSKPHPDGQLEEVTISELT
jgi:UDP-GlcNAc:undecaprenyl-phosphate GlcNAc-1-phosphate transferase